MKLHPIKLALEPKQLSRLGLGHRIHIKHDQIGHGHVVSVPSKIHTRAMKAQQEGKGFHLQLSVPELNAQGAGFLDKLKEAGSWIKKNVFENPVYKASVAPILKQALQQGVQRGSSFAGPLAPEAAQVGQKVVDLIGSKTGAYGLKKGSAEAKAWGERMRAIRAAKGRGGSFRPAGAY